LDRDGDGVVDEIDACPDSTGIETDDAETNGCPDSDGDKIVDKLDACVSTAGVASVEAKKNGCPLPTDKDRDGVLDVNDACPEEPGVETEDPATNGCAPPQDTDQDTVMDPEDACPTVKGKPSADPKKNGCPAARIEKGQIRIIERVEFDTGSSKIQAGSDSVLSAVLEVLKNLPESTKLNIEGHTDDRGNDAANKDLSRRRAESVKKWLVARGISPNRLSSLGYGEERPLGTNETEEGRQDNRRVEFHIVEVDAKAASQGESR
jgi:outer membrane protein OmpA-like peptidoglycan-associated protein